jgi:hypothetical protein
MLAFSVDARQQRAGLDQTNKECREQSMQDLQMSFDISASRKEYHFSEQYTLEVLSAVVSTV